MDEGVRPEGRTEPGGDRRRISAALEFRPWLEAVAQISAAVNNMEPLGNVLNAIAATTCALLDYEFGAVFLAEDDRLVVRGWHGLSSTFVTAINTVTPIRLDHGPLGEAPSSRAFRGHRPVVVRDYRQDPTVGPWAAVAAEHDFRSLAAIPLIVSGRAIGTLNHYTRDVHEFSADELLLLQTIANQAALAIETARLREQERATIAHLEAARRSLEGQAAVLERSEQIHAELTRVVLDDTGLGAIADALAGILGGPVVIDDPRGSLLAVARRHGAAVEVPREVLSDPDFIDRIQVRLGAREPFELVPDEAPSLPTPTFVAPVVIDRGVVGRLWVLGADRPLEALERRALEHGATVVAIELLKQRIANEVEGRLAGELLGDLLGDHPPDVQTACIRAHHLGHDLATAHAAIVVAFDAVPDDDTPALAASRNRQLQSLVQLLIRRHHAEALVGELEGRLVVLLADPAGRGPQAVVDLANAIRREVRAYLAGSSVSVATGPLSDDVGSHARSYRVARGALELSQRCGAPDRTVSVETLGVHGLLLSVDRLDELVRFSRHTLEPLRTYDRRRNSDLVATLAAFLAHKCRLGETAEALVVHPNTIAYRIRRIEQLLDRDLGAPDQLLSVQLALMIDNILGGT